MKSALQEQLFDRLNGVCVSITKENFSRKYDTVKGVVLELNDLGLLKDEMIEALNNFAINNSLDEYQEEVISEIVNCIIGYTSPGNLLLLR